MNIVILLVRVIKYDLNNVVGHVGTTKKNELRTAVEAAVAALTIRCTAGVENAERGSAVAFRKVAILTAVHIESSARLLARITRATAQVVAITSGITTIDAAGLIETSARLLARIT